MSHPINPAYLAQGKKIADGLMDAAFGRTAAPQSAATRYDELVVTTWHGNGRHEIQVDRAPDVALCSVELLQRMHTWYFAGPDRINVGVDMTTRPPTRKPVWYQITGWDTEHKALIITRIPEPKPSTKETP